MSLAMAGSATSGYNLTKSLRFRSSASAYLNRTFGTPTSATTWTISTWVKRGQLGTEQVLFGVFNSATDYFYFGFDATDVLQIFDRPSGGGTNWLTTTQVFRDPAAWYNIVYVFDTTQTTSTNRQKLYINGVQVTSFSTQTPGTQNSVARWNASGNVSYIGRSGNSSGQAYIDMYQAELNFIDGLALTPSSFGSTNAATGVWQPAKYTGTYGANGFYLPFIDNSTTTSSITGNTGIGRDFSGNGNYWTTNNISLATGTYSSLTSGSGNYTVPAGVTSLSYLVVAGGGGGYSGGGGAGGLLFGTMAVTPGQTIAYSVGAGGTGGNYGSSINATNGTDTTFGALTAIGGGAGTSAGNNGNTGGSGSGGAGSGSGTTAGGAGTSGQGFAGGGNAGFIASPYPSGGGGGASAVGNNAANSTTSGAGGAGLTWINGSTYGGGGGGGTFSPSNPAGAGGSGGGGGGGSTGNGTAGTPNTGGGGGGSPLSAIGGAGGSGVIIVGYGSSVTYDSMTDVPTLTNPTTANYCVLNPLDQRSLIALSNANLHVQADSSGSWGQVRSTVAFPTTGKWYWEFVFNTGTNSFSTNGIGNSGTSLSLDYAPSSWANIYQFMGNGTLYANNTSSSYGSSLSSGDVLMVAFDRDNSAIYFGKNGTWFNSSNPATQTSPAASSISTSLTFFPMCGSVNASGGDINFGQQGFAYTPPTGFVALNTYNLPNSTVVKGNTVMDATTYAGTSATQSVTNTAGFKPDFIWVKNRTGANDNILFDSNRGSNGSYYYELISNGTVAENYYSPGNYGMVSAINSNGFTLASSNSNWNLSNATGNNYVGWQWQAGQGSSSSNTDGSITSTVSVSKPAGFSVVTYTGTGSNATVGHGLGVAPSMIIVKRRDAGSSGWSVYFITLAAGYILALQSTAAQANSAARFTTTLPTSTVFSIGTDSDLNASAGTYVAYCWTPIAGYSAFGSYTGNGSTDGPFIYTGFRPKFVMFKASSGTTGNWVLLDTSRDTYNMAVNVLEPDVSDAEAVLSPMIDILSNGYKIRRSSAGTNGSGNTYIYMAFAENPFKNALAR